MSNTTVSKGKKRAARERLNKFLSVLLSVAMVLQTSPVAYARWDEGGAEGYSYDAAVPEEMTTTSEEVVAEAEPEPQPEPQVEEQAPVDEVANNSSNIVEAPEGTDVAEQTAEIAEQQVEEQAPEAMASISVYVENATLTIDGNQLTNSTGTLTTPEGKAISFSVAAAEGYELKEDSVKVSVDGFESALAGNGSYALDASQVKNGTMIIVRAAKADTKTEYMYEDDYVRVTATLDKASAIPDDAILSVTPIFEGSTYYNYDAYMEALNNRVAGENTYDNQNTLLYDVAFLWVDPATGQTVELQPEEGAVTVKFTFRQRQLSDGLQAGSAANVEVNHLPLVDSAKEATTYESTDIKASDVVVEPMGTNPTSLNTLEVRTDSFSVFAFSYTVDFTYDGYTLKLEGNGSIMLSQILSILNIPVNMADISAVDFTNYDLLSFEKQGDDWKVTSLRSFNTPETLTITLANGNKYVIEVTDPEVSPGVWDLGNTDNTQFLHVSAEQSVTENEQERDAAFKLTFTYSLEEDVVRAMDAYEGHPTLVYNVSEFLADSPLSIKDIKNGTISIGTRKLGTYKMVDGKVQLEFTDTSYFDGRTTFTGFFTLTAETDATKLGDEDEWTYEFPGTGDTVTIHYKKKVQDGNKSVSKSGPDANGNYTLHYTANINVNDSLDSMVFNDTLGGLQTLDASSVKINGTPVSVQQSGQNFSFNVANALGTEGVAKGTYRVTYDTTVTKEQLEAMSSQTTLETNIVTWRVDGTKDVPGGKTEITIEKPKEPIPVTKTIADGRTQRVPGEEITYNITYGNDKTELSGFEIADYMTDLQVAQGKITITFNGQTVEIDPKSESTDDSYSTNMVTVFDYTFLEGTPGNGPVTVTYKTKIIDAETAKNNGIYDTKTLTNIAEEKRQNTKSTVTPKVDFEKEPTPPSVVKVAEGTYAANNTINYTLTIGDADTAMAGVHIWDEMTDLQVLNTDSVMIKVGNGNPVKLNDYVANAITYTDDGKYGDSNVKIFDFNMPSNAGNGPVVITYSTRIISEDTAHAQNIYGDHNIKNVGHGGKGSDGTSGVGPFGDYPIDKDVTQDGQNVNAKEVPGATVEPGSTVHYTMTFGKAGMNLAGATISDSMTYLQELVGPVTIIKSDGTSFEMPHGTSSGASDGVVWDFSADEKYDKNKKLRVFNYTLPNDIGEGPITVEYDALIINEEQATEAGIEGKVPAYNTFTANNHSVETEVDIKFPVSPNHDPQVRKEFDRWDVTNSMAYWNIIVEKDDASAYPIENVTVTENDPWNRIVFISPKQSVWNYVDFTPSDYDLVNAIVSTDDGTVLTPGVDYTINKENGSFTFATLNERVHINLGIHLPYKIIDETYMKNTVYLNNGKRTFAEATYDNPHVEIIKDGEYDENTRLVEWTVLLNPTKVEFDDSDPKSVIFRDVIPEGLTLVNYSTGQSENPSIAVSYEGDDVAGRTNTFTVNGDASYPEDHKISYDQETGVITADIVPTVRLWDGAKEIQAGLNKQRYVIKYKTMLSEEEWEKITSSATGSEYFTNHVEVTAGDEEPFGAEDTVEVSSDGYLNKYDSTLEDEHGVVIDMEGDTTKEISYTVEINPNGNVLNNGEPLQLTDYISTNMDLNTESVKLVNATMGSDGKLVPADGSPEDIQISYNDDSRLLSIRSIPDATPLLLTYSCFARSQGVDTYRNTATLIGGGSHSSTVEEEHNVQKNDAGVKVDGITMNMHKIDENNISKDLEGAEFQLYECELEIGELTNPEQYDRQYWTDLLAKMDRITAGGGTAAEIEEIKSSFKITNYKPMGDPVRTGDTGFTQWTGLSEHKLYAWKEVTEPENYTGNSDYHYFVGYQHIDVNTDQIPQPLLPEDEQLFRKQAAWALDDACQLANDIRIASMANLTTWTATNVEAEYTFISATKVWEGDSDNLYETRPTAGIELTLYRINADGSKEQVTSEDVSGISNPVRINDDGTGEWPTYIWNKLPAKDADGNELKYTIVEKKIDDYTTTYSDDGEGVTSGNITVTNKMIPKTTNISVTKVWGEGTEKPQQLKVTLKVIKTDKDGVSGEPEDADFVAPYEYYLDAGNDWSYTFANIPTVLVEENEGGQKVKYSLTYLVEEDPSVASKYLVTYTTEDGKTVPASGVVEGSITISNDLKPTTSSFEARKSFPGGTLTAGQFSFQLYRVDSETQKTPLQTKPNDASGKVTFDDVKYTNDMLDGEAEKTFTYEIVEVPGEDATVAYDNAVYTITETLKNVDGQLTVGDRHMFKTVNGVDTEVTSAEFINTKVGTLEVVKTVTGDLTAGDLTDDEKSAITFQVTGPDGYNKTFTLADMGDGFKWSDTGLVPGEYLVVETGAAIDNYTVTTTYKVGGTTSETGSVTVAGGTTTTITVDNKYEEENGSFKIKKVVTENDGDVTSAAAKAALADTYTFTVYTDEECKNAYKVDGQDLTVQLTVNSDCAEVTSDEITGMPAGTYWIKEAKPAKGSEPKTNPVSVLVEAGKTGEAAALATFTNNYETTQAQVKKVWEGDASKKPESLQVDLYKNAETTPLQTVTLDAGNNWTSEVISDLPKKDAQGTDIEYRWVERSMPAGWFLTGSSKDGIVTTLTNTYQEFSLKTSYVGTKTWVGGYPASLTVELYANGEKTSYTPTWTNTNTNTWTYTFSNLPVFDASGAVINYTAKETVPTGYEKTRETPEETSYAEGTASGTKVPPCKDLDITLSSLTDLGFVVIKLTSNEGFVIWTHRVPKASELAQIETRAGNAFNDFNHKAHYYYNGVGTITTQHGTIEAEYHEATKELTCNFSATDDWSQLYYGSFAGSQYNPGTTSFVNAKTTGVSVRKVWNDGENADNTRPASLAVNLMNGTTVVDTLTLNAQNNWTATKTGLPEYDAQGQKINYTWAEASVPRGYQFDGASTSGTITTLTNTELTEASVEKVWNDHNDEAGQRPASLTVKLMNGATEVETFTLNADNNWSAEKAGLPKYDASGTEINYTWAEDETGLPEGYELTGNTKVGTVTTLTNSYDVKTSASVHKVWNDNDDQDRKRPASLTVKLMNGTTVVDTFTLNADNNWSAEKAGLSKYDASGAEINYTWAEDEQGLPEGYKLTGDTKVGTVTTLTNSYSTEKTQATVKKVWDDHDNEDGKRPATLTVTLKAGNEVYGTYTLTADENWEKTVTDLPKNKDGQEIKYTWEESGLPTGYTLASNVTVGTITTITNTHEVTIESSVEKVWNDKDNADGKRPTSIDVTFKKNGTTVETVTLNEDNNWSATKTGLPKYDDQGKEIAYTWEEASAPSGYALTDIESTGAHTKLTNTELTEATVKKVWNDNNDQDGIRPTSLTVKLMNGTTEAGSVTLTVDKNWTDTIYNLPKYDSNGNEINYTWSENLPAGYVMSDPSKDGTITTLTNTHIVYVTDASVKKVWNDNEDAAKKRPLAIDVNLKANGTTVQTVTLKAEEGWTKQITGLPKNAGGQEIVYTWAEPTLTSGYKLTDTSKEGKLTTLTNTLGETEGEIKVKKVLSGRDWTNDDEFTFNIEAADGTPLPKDSDGNPVNSITIGKSDKTADGYVKSFGKIAFTEKGDYTYTIKETKGSAERMTYDETEHTVTLKVVETADGSLAPAEGETLVKTEEFENTYTPDTPGFEKKVADVNDSEATLPEITAIPNETWADSADHDLGDDVPFRLEAKLPSDISAYKYYELTFEDQMESTLFYNGDAEVVTEAGDYPSEVTDVTDHSFKAKVTFGSTAEDADYLPEELAGKSVYVYFTAKLGSDEVEPVYGANGNMNAARLTYTNSATSTGGGDDTETTGWDNVIVFTYKVDVTKTDQTGTKPVTGAKFSLYKIMSDGSEVVVSENNVGVGNVFSFKGLDDGKYVLKETVVPNGYRAADDITFTVTAEHEVLLDGDGWSKTESANTVSDPARTDVLTSLTGNRTESGQIDPNDINARITFTRTDEGLTATVMNDENAKATIEATKKFENWDLFPEGTQFEFTLTAGTAKTFDGADIGDGKAPMPAGEGATAYATKDVTTAKFGEIAYEVPGIYTYTINEVDGRLPGVTYDTDDHEVTVKVNRPADNNNTLKATVAYDGSKEALEVENTFTALKEHFEVTKQLNGRKWTDEDSFTFELAAMAPTDAPMPTGDGATAYATKANGKVAKFGDIEFVKPGKYEYTITEVKPEGAEKINDTHYLLDGVTYETSSHHVIIEVAKSDDSNALVVKSVKYDGEKSLTVTNEYAANGEVNLTATKEVTGDDWPEGAEFTFTLTDVTDPEKPVDLGTATATKGAPTAAFDAIKYENITKDSTHEYTYEVAEVVPDNATNEDGITYAEATDEQKAAGGFMLDGITYAHKPMTVKVKLTDNGDGTLSYAVTSQVEGESTVVINPTEGDPVTYMVGTFENDAYAREATVEFTKAFYGAENGKITFRMTPYIDGAKADGTTAADTTKSPLVYSAAQHIEWTALVKAKSHTVVTSPAITFYKAGTYQYLIEEVTDKAGADEATILATIVVDEDQEPTVTYQVSPYKDAEFMDIDEATFYNNELVTLNFRSAGMRKFNANKMITVFQPEIRKVLENGILAGGEFKFELRDEAGNLVSEATNDENGRVEFAAIRYEEAGEHTYTITEVAGTDSTINYSTETIELKVTVVENKTDGVLTATGTYSQDGKAVEVPTITNKYKTVGIHAVKYSREDLEKGIKTPLAGAHYGLWMVNPDGADIYLGVQESDAGGNLYYDIPTLEGVVYYFKEEEPPPAGHLVDPYPTDYFTLLIEGGQFSLKYFASYDEAVDYIKNNG